MEERVDSEIMFVVLAVVTQFLGLLTGLLALVVSCPTKSWRYRIVSLGTLSCLGILFLMGCAWSMSCTAPLGLCAAGHWLVAITPPCRDWHHDPYTMIYADVVAPSPAITVG